MDKIMALDVGTKRIGIALSDYLHVIATPHSYIQRQPENKALEDLFADSPFSCLSHAYPGIRVNDLSAAGSFLRVAQERELKRMACLLRRRLDAVVPDAGDEPPKEAREAAGRL